MPTRMEIEKVKKFYNKFFESPTYSPLSNYGLNLRKELIIKFAGIQKGESVIEVGCGIGIITKTLAVHSDKVVAVDISENRIHYAIMSMNKNELEKINFVVGDIYNLPFKDHFFDVIVCSEVIEHLSHQKKGIKELLRIMKCRLIITCPNPFNPFLILCKLFGISYGRQIIDNPPSIFKLKKMIKSVDKNLEITKYHTFYYPLPIVNTITKNNQRVQKFFIKVSKILDCQNLYIGLHQILRIDRM